MCLASCILYPVSCSAWRRDGHGRAFPLSLGLPGRAAAIVRPRAGARLGAAHPYEGTTCYGSGTRDGPAAIIEASRQLERYDHELGCEPYAKYGIRTLPPLSMMRKSPDAMIDAVQAAVAGIMSGSPGPRLLVVLGGEHTISAGVVRGLAATVAANNLVVVQIDAHADLWDEYEGSRYSHACAARRIVETCPVFQIGIRAISQEEDRFRRGRKDLRTVFSEEANAGGAAWLQELAAFVQGKDVYLTMDLDGLDPSIMPAVGTPEPDGLTWARALDVVRTVCKHAASVPAFDVVELAPIGGMRAPDFLAAKLVYKTMSLALLRSEMRVGRAGDGLQSL
ncbi:MAG: agmatinase [Planctomycetota bacterium]|nr:agmatinase [Planctomycetota bacterium]